MGKVTTTNSVRCFSQVLFAFRLRVSWLPARFALSFFLQISLELIDIVLSPGHRYKIVASTITDNAPCR